MKDKSLIKKLTKQTFKWLNYSYEINAIYILKKEEKKVMWVGFQVTLKEQNSMNNNVNYYQIESASPNKETVMPKPP
jgi:hypothetical protein